MDKKNLSSLIEKIESFHFEIDPVFERLFGGFFPFYLKKYTLNRNVNRDFLESGGYVVQRDYFSFNFRLCVWLLTFFSLAFFVPFFTCLKIAVSALQRLYVVKPKSLIVFQWRSSIPFESKDEVQLFLCDVVGRGNREDVALIGDLLKNSDINLMDRSLVVCEWFFRIFAVLFRSLKSVRFEIFFHKNILDNLRFLLVWTYWEAIFCIYKPSTIFDYNQFAVSSVIRTCVAEKCGVTAVSWSHSCSLDYVYDRRHLIRESMCFVPCHLRLVPLSSQIEFFKQCRSTAARATLICGPSIRLGINKHQSPIHSLGSGSHKQRGLLQIAVFPASLAINSKNNRETHMDFLQLLSQAALRLGPNYDFCVYGKGDFSEKIGVHNFPGLNFGSSRSGIVCGELLNADAVICMGFTSVIFDSLFLEKPCIVISKKAFADNYFSGWRGLWWLEECTVNSVMRWARNPEFNQLEVMKDELRDLAGIPFIWSEL